MFTLCTVPGTGTLYYRGGVQVYRYSPVVASASTIIRTNKKYIKKYNKNNSIIFLS